MRFEPQTQTDVRLRILVRGQLGRPVDPDDPIQSSNVVLSSDGIDAAPGQFVVGIEWLGGGFGWVLVDNSADDVFFAEGALIQFRIVDVTVEGLTGCGDWGDDEYVVGDYPTEFKPIGANLLTLHASYNGQDVAGLVVTIRSGGYKTQVITDLQGDAEKDLAPALYRITTVSNLYNTIIEEDVDLSGDQHLELLLTMPTLPEPAGEGQIVVYAVLRRHGQPRAGITCYLREKLSSQAGIIVDAEPRSGVTDAEGLIAWDDCEPLTTYVFVPPFGDEIEFTTGEVSPCAIPPGRFFQNS